KELLDNLHKFGRLQLIANRAATGQGWQEHGIINGRYGILTTGCYPLKGEAMRSVLILSILTASLLSARAAEMPTGPQFRGSQGSGLASGDRKLPAEIGPDQNVLWKIDLPPGHSSPVIWGDRIFLTAVRDKKLLTLVLDRTTGKILWEAEAPYKTLEKVHQ